MRLGALLVMCLALPALAGERAACERAYARVVSLAKKEKTWGYAREVLTEGRAAFIADCQKHLQSKETACISTARSSQDLYDCT
jgi:hypothetical protein